MSFMSKIELAVNAVKRWVRRRAKALPQAVKEKVVQVPAIKQMVTKWKERVAKLRKKVRHFSALGRELLVRGYSKLLAEYLDKIKNAFKLKRNTVKIDRQAGKRKRLAEAADAPNKPMCKRALKRWLRKDPALSVA